MKAAFPVAFSASLFLVPVLIPVAGCNSDSTDDTVLEASRAQRISSLADSVCDRYEECEGFGAGKTYGDEDSCEANWEDRMNQAWPAASCGDRQIDSGRYDTCVTRVKAYACSTGGANIADGIAALSECNSSAVCTDAAK